jgi:AraC family transcriptional regulator
MQLNPTAQQQWLHQKCVQHVINHVSDHLCEEHDLRELADIAGFSRFHFHRLFKSVTGENLFGCIRRMRLERTATLLTTERDRTILDIAMEAGFSSQQVFARAFHSHFGMSAGQWRDGDFWWHNGRFWDWRRNDVRDRLKRRGKGRIAGAGRMFYLDPAMADAADGKRPECLATIEVRELASCRIAYIRDVGSMSCQDMEALWQRLERWARHRGLLSADSIAIGIGQDDPTVVAQRHLRYDAGLIVGDRFIATPDIDVQTVPGGAYQVAHFEGPTSEGYLASEYIWQHWFSANGWRQDIRRPAYARVRLGAAKPPAGMDSYDLCVPIRPSTALAKR